jgi:signal transduction histidine kinase
VPLTSPGWEQSLRNLEREFKRLVQALDLLVELDRSIFQTSFNRDALLEAMLNGLRGLVEAEYAQILLRTGNELVIVHSTHAEDKGRRFRLDKCVCGLAVQERRTIASGDVKSEYPDRYQWVLGYDKQQRMVSEVAVPIYAPALESESTPNHIVAGVINIESPSPDFFSRGNIELVEKFAIQAGAAMNNARIHTGLALTLQLAESIQVLDQPPDVALRETLRQLSNLFQEGVIVQFLLYDAASTSLIIKSSTAAKTEGKSVLVDDSFSGLAIKNQAPVRSNDVRSEYPHLFKDTIRDVGLSPTQSELAVPIKADGRIIGVLNVESAEREAFSRYDEYMLTVIAANASIWTRIYKSKSVLALEKMATVGQVSGHLIHTVNNGLSRLSRIADSLQRIRDRADPATRDALAVEIGRLSEVPETIQDSINSLQEMYKQALEIHESVNINDFARRVEGEIITREDIHVNWELDPNMPGLRISNGVYHVFWNLISNAQRAIEEGRPGVITIGTKIIYGQYTGRSFEAYELYVADNGKGMSEEERSKATQLDYSTKKGRITGYGLWWVATFVDRWEGKLDIQSEKGKGTCVRIRFPLTREGVASRLVQETQR